MREDLSAIKSQLSEICDKEALRLWRQARRMKAHGVSDEIVWKCKKEASELWKTAYPERILDDFFEYQKDFAFK